MEIYIAVIIIFIIIAFLILGAAILFSLNFIHLKFLEAVNSIKRYFWQKNIVGLPDESLRKMLAESENSLVFLKSRDTQLSTELGIKGRETENFFLLFKIDAVEAEISDAEAKINILRNLIR